MQLAIALLCCLVELVMSLAPMHLGVCYYPEQWNRSMWESDFQRMHSLGLSYVRLGEFSWSNVEPSPGGSYNWQWLDDVLLLAQQNQLGVVLGTPTATPPKWLMDKYRGQIEPVGRDGQVRHFGSRRHYSFSSSAYWNESARIVTALADRYGEHPAIVGWQIDNEYGCHDTVRTFDLQALSLFRDWLRKRYHNDINLLNTAWGNSFWSMNYGSFEEVELPNLTVTDANPSAWLDFYRFSSDQLRAFNRMQVSIIRDRSPNRFITHNMMGFFFQFDAFALAKETLDFVSWDSYPLGFTDTSLGLGSLFSDDEKAQYFRTGHPDLASFHHALYRGMGMGQGKRFWIMEQQPGPVNWGQHNPSPEPGMVRLWSLEAFAHGADTVSYFRWRQATHAQEQMHAGLNRPDNVPDTAFTEIQSLVKDIVELQKFTSPPTLQSSNALARVALIVDYEAQWTFEIQPQGAEFSYVQQAFAMYSAARSLTLDVHIVSVAQLETDKLALQSFCLVLIPSQPHVSGPLAAALAAFVGPIVFGPRTGSKTVSFGIPESLPPSMPLQSTLLPLKVTRVESLRPNVVDSVRIPLADDSGALSNAFQIGTWREWAELIDSEQNSKAADFAFPGVSYVTSSQAKLSKRRARILSVFDSDGRPAILGFDDPSNTAVTSYYLAFAPTVPLLSSLFAFILTEKSIPFIYLPSSLRISSLPADPTSNQSLFFAFYYDSTSYSLDMIADGSRIALNGSRVIGPHSVVVFDRISFAKSDPNSDWTSGPWFIGGMVALAVFLAFLVACMRSTKSPTESEHSLLLPSVNADQMS